MKILIDTQIKEADLYTIQNEPIESVSLMERASHLIAEWISANIPACRPLCFLIGKGNNGGDGLAVARILFHAGYECSVYLTSTEDELSKDSRINFERLPSGVKKCFFEGVEGISPQAIIVDALLGTGVKGSLKEPVASVIHQINQLPNQIIAIDLPSGMKTEFDNNADNILHADITLTLQFPKLAMLLPEAGNCCGDVHILPIGLDENYICAAPTHYHYITKEYVDNLLLKREKFAHKGTYGHALLVCGSKGMAGAAILATGAALRSGCGLVTIHLPGEERQALQCRYPSALVSTDREDCFSHLPENMEKYSAVGIGCGLGQHEKTVSAFRQLLCSYQRPVVIDADALNILSRHTDLKKMIPKGSILTPHLGELKRLTGGWKSEGEKIRLAGKLASDLNCIVIVKGAYSMVCLPDGRYLFNSTGNAGMAKGGSGDVLAGLITGLLARGYDSEKAAVLGVYLHGLAGDKAASKWGQESINSDDLIDFLSLVQ